MSNSSLFGQKLKEALKNAGLTQKEASAKLGISPGSMTNYVHGRIPEAEILLKISQLCNKPMEWFLTEQDTVQAARHTKNNSDLRDRLRDAMAWNGMTIQELAEALNITNDEARKVSEGILTDPGVAVDLCRVLDITSDWLFNGKGEGPPYWGEFINTQHNFFSALAKFISHIILIDKQDLQQVLEGTTPAEILVPQNSFKDEILASLQILLRSPAWKRRLRHSQTAGGPYEFTRTSRPLDTEKHLFSVAERDETKEPNADAAHRTANAGDKSAIDQTGAPAPSNPYKPGKP